MNDSDELVNRWFLSKWTNDGNCTSVKYNPKFHGPPENISVVAVSGGWDCSCYSTWTRDDMERLSMTLRTDVGLVDVEYYGDFPDMILELIDFGSLGDYCSIERWYENNLRRGSNEDSQD